MLWASWKVALLRRAFLVADEVAGDLVLPGDFCMSFASAAGPYSESKISALSMPSGLQRTVQTKIFQQGN
eukprot:258802-Amphidinium_carterae.1